jgi:dTMP kinase
LRKRGRLITVEGGEGTGKSTQVRLLASVLAGEGVDVVTTREPGGTEGAEAIRELLLRGTRYRWDGLSEALLHYAARRLHLDQTILPALDRGSWVISDRFADSTMAYQGYGSGVALARIRALHALVVGTLAPDLTLILDIDAETGCARARARSGIGDADDRYQAMDRAFHERVRRGFLTIAEAEPERCVVVDASAGVEAVAAIIRRTVAARLGVPAP